MTRDEIWQRVVATLTEMFEIDAASITPDSRLIEDLDLDSIDAIDMAVRIQEITGQRVDETSLRKARSVGDVVDLIDRILRSRS